MDSTKEYSNYPKWPKEKGTSYFPIFVHELCSFMCRIGLMIFAHQTVADKANKGPSCFKCGASGPDFPCSAPGCDQRHTHCIDFHEKVMQIAERNKKKQAGTDVAVADKPMHYMNL